MGCDKAMDPRPEPTGPDAAGPSAASTGTVYGRGGVPVDGRPLDLMSRLHPAVTATVAVAIIAVMTLGYLIWRSSVTQTPPATAAPAGADAASPPTDERPDASPSPSPSASPTGLALAPGTWSLESTDQPGRYVRRRADLGTVDSIDAAAGARDRRDASLIVTEGLADRSCFTFRTLDGRYLRHYDFRLKFDEPENSDIFRKDATFCAEDGAGGDPVRLRSHNYPDRTVHRRGAELWLDRPDGSQAFSAASSFTVRAPLAVR